MKPFEFRPFVKEDFPEAPWMERLFRLLNSVLTQLQTGVTKGLTFGDNLNAEIRTVDVPSNGTAATSRKDPKFTTVVKGKAAGVLVLGCVQIVGSSQVPTAVTGLAWEQNGPTIILKTLGGLDVTKAYRLTVLVVGG